MEKQKLSGKYSRNRHDLMLGEIIHYKNTQKGKSFAGWKEDQKTMMENESK